MEGNETVNLALSLPGGNARNGLVSNVGIHELDRPEHVGIQRGLLRRVLLFGCRRGGQERNDLVRRDLRPRYRILRENRERRTESGNRSRINLLIGVELADSQLRARRRRGISEQFLIHAQGIGKIAFGHHHAALRGVDFRHQRDHFGPPPERQTPPNVRD